jgi:hypothetical protein
MDDKSQFEYHIFIDVHFFMMCLKSIYIFVIALMLQLN